nr:uncharacterized protein LOC122271415 [Parasteatoda tepidariorum]
MEERVTILKKKRGLLRSSVTKALNVLENELKTELSDISVLEECLHFFLNKNKSLELINKELEVLFRTEEFEDEFSKSEEYSEKVVRCKFRATKKIQELNENMSNEKSKNKKSLGLDESANYKSEQKESIRIKLPKLSIPKYYGELKQWLTFWNSFESAIHNNDSLDKIDKFNYLKAHLGGTALNTIEGFSISEETYDTAVKLLKERFARTDILINAHMNNIINMQPLKNSRDVIAFRKFYDNINTQIRSLESLGLVCKNYGNVLCPILIKILPPDLVLEYNRRESETESDIKELLSFLSKELNSRERSAIMNRADDLRPRRFSESFSTSRKQNISDTRFKYNKSENKNKFISASELIFSEINENMNKKLCGFCDSSKHESSVCEYANDLSVEEKKDILLKKGICFKCLENKGHIARFCRFKVVCSRCQGKHQTVLCFSKFDHDIKDKNSPNSEDNVLTNQTSSETVYLQTLIVRIHNKGKEHFIRGIYDSGSQKSYISKFVAERMGLEKLGEKEITHGLFGRSQSAELHNRFALQLSSNDRKYSCELVAMDQTKICTNVPRANNFELQKDLESKDIILTDISPKSKECLHERNLNEHIYYRGPTLQGSL